MEDVVDICLRGSYLWIFSHHRVTRIDTSLVEVSMEHFVPLERLPEDFSIPRDLADRFRYDDRDRRLVHLGFMSKCEFDRLVQLSHDWGYRRALEDLFRLCTDESDAPQRGLARRLHALLSGIGLF